MLQRCGTMTKFVSRNNIAVSNSWSLFLTWRNSFFHEHKWKINQNRRNFFQLKKKFMQVQIMSLMSIMALSGIRKLVANLELLMQKLSDVEDHYWFSPSVSMHNSNMDICWIEFTMSMIELFFWSQPTELFVNFVFKWVKAGI